MSMTTVAYARRAYKSFSRSARHLYQLIASHQDLHTGWAYLSYGCLAEESSLTPRRVMQLVAFLEAETALEGPPGANARKFTVGHSDFFIKDLSRPWFTITDAYNAAKHGGTIIRRCDPILYNSLFFHIKRFLLMGDVFVTILAYRKFSPNCA